MGTIDKALDVLGLFTRSRPSVGLSQAARLLGRDKASVLRYLNALQSRGFLEQDSVDRTYHLGPALARLALIREVTYPLNQVAGEVLQKLVDETGETAHLSHYDNGHLATVAVVETRLHSTRVYLDPAQPLPLHASASGIAYLSCLDAKLASSHLPDCPEIFTPDTPTDAATAMALMRQAAQDGFAVARGTFEADVCGVAAPVFGASNQVCGAVGVATPSARFDEPALQTISRHVVQAAAQISHHYGATRPPILQE